MKSIAQYAELKPNWDSYGAVPPTVDVIRRAEEFAVIAETVGLTPRPVATSAGSVCLQFGASTTEDGPAVELDFNIDGSTEADFFGRSGDDIFDRVTPDHRLAEAIRSWIRPEGP